MSYTINKSNGVVAAKASLLRQLCAVRQIDPADSSGKNRLKQVLSARRSSPRLATARQLLIASRTIAANHAGWPITCRC